MQGPAVTFISHQHVWTQSLVGTFISHQRIGHSRNELCPRAHVCNQSLLVLAQPEIRSSSSTRRYDCTGLPYSPVYHMRTLRNCIANNDFFPSSHQYQSRSSFSNLTPRRAIIEYINALVALPLTYKCEIYVSHIQCKQ